MGQQVAFIILMALNVMILYQVISPNMKFKKNNR